MRIANAPSVVSNVFLGFMIGWLVRFHWMGADLFDFAWPQALLACCGGVLLYFSGNLANDWFDRNWDAEKRPERALPSGMFRPSSYLVFSLLLASLAVLSGFMLSVLSGCTALAICLLIAIYTFYHKRAIWAVVPMGLCRAGLYFFGFFAQWMTPAEIEALEMFHIGPSSYLRTLVLPSILAVGLFSYIAGLSLSARYEGMDDPPQGPKVISLAMLILPIAAMSCMIMDWDPALGVLGMIPFAFWLGLCLTRFRKPIPRYVSALLAGIPLVDLIASLPMALGTDKELIEQNLADLPHLLAMLVIPAAAFILGRALQKLAPAT
ncbi:UbiA family prenyltransferase [Luteolibacter sp. Populi]|uniref:UbiA family prenyltransferase n=1 Tax=Luteolibacter sp. Populi TaxID=3230487 RepID=UPI003467D439